MRQRAYVFRGAEALGDCLFMSALPRLLAEQGYEVTLGLRPFTQPLFEHNPHIAHFDYLPENYDLQEWMDNWRKEVMPKYDWVYSTSSQVEVAYLHRTDLDYGGFPKIEELRQRAAGVNYYDSLYAALGVSRTGVLPEVYFSPEEHDLIEEQKEIKQKAGKRLILWQTHGSSQCKKLDKTPEWLRHLDDAGLVHYVWCPNPDLIQWFPKQGNIKQMWGTSVRETLRLIAMADLVVGPESFMVNAAAAIRTPSAICYSHSTPDNLARYYPNSTAIVPECDCHPCYLIPINFRHVYNPWQRRVAREIERACQLVDINYEYRLKGYKCCYFLPDEQVIATVKRRAYE